MPSKPSTTRNSYKLWEGEPVPSFVLEVLSGTTADKDLGEKRNKYAAMGVTEFWTFDPLGERIAGHIAGFRLRDGVYEPIDPLPGTRIHPSNVLGLEFRANGGDLCIRDPEKGEDFVGYEEERDARIAEALARQEAEERAAAAASAQREAQEEAAAAAAEVERLRRILRDRGQ